MMLYALHQKKNLITKDFKLLSLFFGIVHVTIMFYILLPSAAHVLL
jgi:hypothetical protein